MEYMHAQAMEATVKLFKGVEDSSFIRRRPHLLTFLKGSAKQKLKEDYPVLHVHFEAVWSLKSTHIVRSHLLGKYAFILHWCGKRSCVHPLYATAAVALKS